MDEKRVVIFPSIIRFRLGVHKGRELNEMKWNDHKGMEMNGMFLSKGNE